jgi:predicted flap endonuclease-1-like 5' DNA nuclease
VLIYHSIEGDDPMTLAPLLAKTWLAASLFFQTGSVPIWVPLTIILLIILIFWWGLTRNRIPDENETVGEHEAENGELEAVDEPPDPIEEAASDTSEEPEPVTKDAGHTPEKIDEPKSPPDPDDLKIIEGVGPKIATVLADAGITTFAQLASTNPEQLDKIVRVDAGIKVANPSSWPEQAAFAASGDWDGLEKMQKQLITGRHPD